MSVIRINKTRDYTVMSNHHFRVKEMSMKAKGLLSLMLSLPENWDYTVRGLVAISKESKSAIQGMLKELETFGYLVRNRKQNEKGQFEYEYFIYEVPVTKKPWTEKPYTENPYTDTPCTENQPQLSTKELITKESNTKELITNKEKDKEIDNSRESVPYQQIVDAYNETCVSLPAVKKLTPKRKQSIKARLKDYSLEDFLAVFQAAQASSFLNGSSGKWVGATFDWLLNESNMIKVLEGNYADKPAPSGQKASYNLHEYEQQSRNIFDQLLDEKQPDVITVDGDDIF